MHEGPGLNLSVLLQLVEISGEPNLVATTEGRRRVRVMARTRAIVPVTSIPHLRRHGNETSL